jgi:hypothetical protein
MAQRLERTGIEPVANGSIGSFVDTIEPPQQPTFTKCDRDSKSFE